MFEVPASLYASKASARTAARRIAAALAKGGSPVEAAGPLVPITPENAGLIVLARGWSSIPTEAPQFHIDLPWRELENRADRASFVGIVHSALEHTWVLAGLVGSQQYSIVRSAAAQLRFLDAAREHWASIVAVGARYTTGSNYGESIETTPTLVHFCLARQGATVVPREPLTPTRLDVHLANLPGYRVRDLLAHGDVDAALELLDGHRDITTCSLAEHFLAIGKDDEACRRVIELAVPDPHGCVADWLAGRGNPARLVR
jgi:hypothetical protein